MSAISQRDRLFVLHNRIDFTLGDTPWSSIQAQGLSHHLMRRALSQEEGERGEYVYAYAYLYV